MDKKELKKRCRECDVYLTPEDLARWADLYKSRLIDELYAVEKALTALSWMKSEKEFPLRLDRDTVLKASDTLMLMTAFRHSSETFEPGDYSKLFEKTEDDFFGGIYLRDLVCTLDVLASLMRDAQYPPEQSPHPLEADETKRKK